MLLNVFHIILHHHSFPECEVTIDYVFYSYHPPVSSAAQYLSSVPPIIRSCLAISSMPRQDQGATESSTLFPPDSNRLSELTLSR